MQLFDRAVWEDKASAAVDWCKGSLLMKKPVDSLKAQCRVWDGGAERGPAVRLRRSQMIVSISGMHSKQPTSDRARASSIWSVPRRKDAFRYNENELFFFKKDALTDEPNPHYKNRCCGRHFHRRLSCWGCPNDTAPLLWYLSSAGGEFADAFKELCIRQW